MPKLTLQEIAPKLFIEATGHSGKGRRLGNRFSKLVQSATYESSVTDGAIEDFNDTRYVRESVFHLLKHLAPEYRQSDEIVFDVSHEGSNLIVETNIDFTKANEFCERLLKMAENDGLKGHLAKGKKIRGEILLVKTSSGKQSAVSSKLKAKSQSLMANELKASEKELKEALRIAEGIEAKPLQWQIHASLGNIYSASDKKGSNNKAKEHFTKSIEIIQKIASTIGDEKLKKTFLNSKQVRSILEINW